MAKERLDVSALQLGLMTVTGGDTGDWPHWGSSLSVTTKKGHFFVGDLELSEEEGSEVKVGCWARNQTCRHGDTCGRCWLHGLGFHPREACIQSTGSQQSLSA